MPRNPRNANYNDSVNTSTTANNDHALTTVIHEMLLNDKGRNLLDNPSMLRVNRQISNMTVKSREIADRGLLNNGRRRMGFTPKEHAQWVCSEPGHAREFMALIRLARVDDEPRAVTIARNCIRTNTLVEYDQMVHDPCLVRVLQRDAHDVFHNVFAHAALIGHHRLLDFVLRDHPIDFSLDGILETAQRSCIPVLLEFGAGPVTHQVLVKLCDEIALGVTRYDPIVLLRHMREPHINLSDSELEMIQVYGRLHAQQRQPIDLKNVLGSLDADVSSAFVDGLLSVWCKDDEWLSRCFAETLANIDSMTDEVGLISDMCSEPVLQHCLIEYSLTHGSLNDMNKMLAIPGFLDRVERGMVVNCLDVERSWILMRLGVSVTGWRAALEYIAIIPGGASVAEGVMFVLGTALYDPYDDSHEDRASPGVLNIVTKIIKSNAQWIDPVQFVHEMIDKPGSVRQACVLAVAGVPGLAAGRFVLSLLTPAWITVVREFCPIYVSNHDVDVANVDSAFNMVKEILDHLRLTEQILSIYKALSQVLDMRAGLMTQFSTDLEPTWQVHMVFAVLDVCKNPRLLGELLATSADWNVEIMMPQIISYIRSGSFTSNVCAIFLEGLEQTFNGDDDKESLKLVKILQREMMSPFSISLGQRTNAETTV
jgi:hypothetical protein